MAAIEAAPPDVRALIRGTQDMGAIGAIIRETRLAQGWTQERLAQETGLVRPMISRYENGRALPDWATFLLIAAALGLAIALIRSGARVPTP
jgi:transcriptional regulator with XRE-family HTH domain